MHAGFPAALTARPRLIASFAAGLLSALLLPASTLSTRFLVGWDVGTSVFLILAGIMIARSSHADLQWRADREDAGAFAILGITAAATAAGMAAIFVELQGGHGGGDGGKSVHLALSGVTILLSWVFVHTIFALHYAHDFYAGEDDRGGLTFPGDETPDYADFLYFSFNIGAAAQTSDVEITAKRMRRVVLAQTVLAFLFNTTILALAVNVGAGMI